MTMILDRSRRPWAAVAIAFWAGLGVGWSARGSEGEPRIDGVEASAVRIGGLDRALLEALRDEPAGSERWRAACAVRVEGADADVVGKWAVDGDGLVFRPRFGFEPGVGYRVIVRATDAVPTGRREPIELAFGLPEEGNGRTTEVVSVDPVGPELPCNVLRFYVHFSGPMSRGQAYRHARLVDAEGRTVEHAFLELGEELWDPDLTRCTLLLDPGRIKRGLVPHAEMGPILVQGRDYELVIDEGWVDARGARLARGHRLPFHAGAEDVTPPEPSGWKVVAPKPGSADPLVVEFGEPLDRALVSRLIAVETAQGKRIGGEGRPGEDASTWSFAPEGTWEAGGYRLRVDTDLEDRAGNKVGQRFEVDVFDRVEREVVPEVVYREFRVGP